MLGDLFDLIVPLAARHRAFEALRTSPIHAGARRLMNDLAQRMGDIDGNLVCEFQTQFHARLFELACFAYLEAQGFAVDRSHAQPDFLLTRDRAPVAAVEAVTANSRAGQQTDISARAVNARSREDIADRCSNDFPIKMGGALSSKLKRAYWELPHCKGLPFVLVVGPFHEPGSMTYIDQSLARYLYGVEAVADVVHQNQGRAAVTHQVPVRWHTFKGKRIPSNFFGYPSAENVSAVVYCNQFTVPRFFRLAAQTSGWSTELAGTRKGSFVSPDEVLPRGYSYPLGEPRGPVETWWQGATVFHNPGAAHPLPSGALRRRGSQVTGVAHGKLWGLCLLACSNAEEMNDALQGA
jgi:hypothetical protein